MPESTTDKVVTFTSDDPRVVNPIKFFRRCVDWVIGIGAALVPIKDLELLERP